MSIFADFHLQPLSQEVKSYYKDTNQFLKKTWGLRKISEELLLLFPALMMLMIFTLISHMKLNCLKKL